MQAVSASPDSARTGVKRPFCPNFMPVIPAPAGSAMSSSKLVHKLVHKLVRQTSADRGATPFPILHVSSYSADQCYLCLSLS